MCVSQFLQVMTGSEEMMRGERRLFGLLDLGGLGLKEVVEMSRRDRFEGVRDFNGVRLLGESSLSWLFITASLFWNSKNPFKTFEDSVSRPGDMPQSIEENLCLELS